MREHVTHFLVACFLVTVFCGLIYLVTQQNYRISANDPQIQLAEDTAQALNQNEPPAAVVPQTKISIERSLAPFVVIYDTTGRPIAGNGELAGALPTLPSGVFLYVQKNGEDRFTWQPEDGVRDASVVTAYKNGFVMSGRSLRETERRENKLTVSVAALWVIGVGGVFLLYWLTDKVVGNFSPKPRNKKK